MSTLYDTSFVDLYLCQHFYLDSKGVGAVTNPDSSEQDLAIGGMTRITDRKEGTTKIMVLYHYRPPAGRYIVLFSYSLPGICTSR